MGTAFILSREPLEVHGQRRPVQLLTCQVFFLIFCYSKNTSRKGAKLTESTEEDIKIIN
jgi:hypothetical protein